jgi:hypothetical protein
MKVERSDVEFPLWRKKVDKSLFDYNGTPIPNWACKMWGLIDTFGEITSRKDDKSKVRVQFLNRYYDGWITANNQKRKIPFLRLWYEEELSLKLKYAFLMSYMRSLEQRLSKDKDIDIEKEIPFWEFLDIEYDETNREFYFHAYYRQAASFPNLFERLVESPGLKRVADELECKEEPRIHKQEWKLRDQLPFEIGSTNVLYLLLDTEKKLIYVGEASDLIARLSQPHPSIPNWNLYRYNVLPSQLMPFRITLERMLIRDIASLFPNKKKVKHFGISDYRLANHKIDK